MTKKAKPTDEVWHVTRSRRRSSYEDSFLAPGVLAVYTPHGICHLREDADGDLFLVLVNGNGRCYRACITNPRAPYEERPSKFHTRRFIQYCRTTWPKDWL